MIGFVSVNVCCALLCVYTAIQWVQFTCVLPKPPLLPCVYVHYTSVCVCDCVRARSYVQYVVHIPFVSTSVQVGAAISMTYVTGQPIVFVGTGQTYSDLKNLNVQSVVQALLS